MSLQPHLTQAIIAAVIGAGALHAGWNAPAKQIPDRLMAFAWIGIASAITGGLVLSLTGKPAPAVWFAVASAVIHLGYDAAIRQTSVVFAALIGVIALGEDFGKRRGPAALVIAVGLS